MILSSVGYLFETIVFTCFLDPARTTTLSHGRHFEGAVPFSINCSALDDSADAKIQVVLSHCGGSRSLHGDTFLLRTSLPVFGSNSCSGPYSTQTIVIAGSPKRPQLAHRRSRPNVRIRQAHR